jgi:N-acetylglucosamine malate deacetylase 1
MTRVLVISPHPDDDVIGCGGTLRRHVLHGDQVRVIYLTSGGQGGHGRPPDETAHLREAEARAAASILGLQDVEFWREPDGGCRVTQNLVERLRVIITDWQPRRIYVPHEQEMHPDHRAAARLVRRAMSIQGAPSNHTIVLTYEVWTPLQNIDEIVDITPFLDDKIAAIRAHKSQCTVLKFDEAIQGLNRYRGEMYSWPGGDYAEVFAHLALSHLK